ncbi:MAG: tRNA pseudouridine(13) synthase TruD [Gammaproteobacteria bacterium]|jgi:tRNA pseudouridine13 synthase
MSAGNSVGDGAGEDGGWGRLAHAWPPLGVRGRIRVRPQDFTVSEELGFRPDGEGEHGLLRVRKTGCNTQWVARTLARAGGVSARDVGYAGLKDRHAVTEQWFSVPARAIEPLRATDLGHSGIEILDTARHRRKLRRGAHRANRFRIVVRDLAADDGDLAGLEDRLGVVAERGVPNYFGPQRFGRDGGNLDLIPRIAGGQRVNRQQRGFALSAARSYLFNAVLSARVAQGSWDRLLPGDLAMLHGSRSTFPVTVTDPTLERRLSEHDIHPSGPLWGRGGSPAGADVGALEDETARSWSDGVEVLSAAGLDQERRALRLTVADLSWDFEGQSLILGFDLGKGGFATAVLRELIDLGEAPGQDLLRNRT